MAHVHVVSGLQRLEVSIHNINEVTPASRTAATKVLFQSCLHASFHSLNRQSVIYNWPERIKTQPHDDRDNCFLPFDSKGPCGMTMLNDIDDDSATKHSDSHARNSHRQSV